MGCSVYPGISTFTLELILNAEINYEDIRKDKFIKKLSDGFNDHLAWGDSELLPDFDSCNGCNCNQAVCKFIGNYSGKTFALFFEIKNEKINDIYHCYSYGDINLLDPF
ncbi:MAG: hypothetical protein WAV86_05990 [Lutibacter sp.]